MMTPTQTVIVTGGNTGLGFEAARALAESDQAWHVVIACRNPAKAAEAVQTIAKRTAKGRVEAMSLDLCVSGIGSGIRSGLRWTQPSPAARRRAQRRQSSS